MMTLQLAPELEQRVTHAANHLGLSKSEFILQSLVNYLEQFEKKGAWETGQDLFGKYASGCGDLSTKRKQLLRDRAMVKCK